LGPAAALPHEWFTPARASGTESERDVVRWLWRGLQQVPDEVDTTQITVSRRVDASVSAIVLEDVLDVDVDGGHGNRWGNRPQELAQPGVGEGTDGIGYG